MSDLDERVDYLINEDLIPFGLRYLKERHKVNRGVEPRGVLLEGKKYVSKVKRAFKLNTEFRKRGFVVKRLRGGIFVSTKRQKELRNSPTGRWACINLDDYFKTYLEPGHNPPTADHLKMKYED